MKSFLSAAAIVLLLSPAYAQEPVDFSGAYVGANLNRTDSSSFSSASDIDASSDGFSVTAGYLFDAGAVMIGGDLTYRRNEYSGTNITTSTAISGTATSTALGVRLGYPMGRTMPFVGARVGRGTDDFGTGSFDFDTRELVIGAEFALTEQVFTHVTFEHAVFDYRGTNLSLRNNGIALGLLYRF